MTSALPRSGFWRDKRVVVTGHTGFKGGWLTVWLSRMGAEVTGISLPPLTHPSLFELARIQHLCNSHFCDVRSGATLASYVRDARPEIVFHLAAQPLVRVSYRQPADTFATNVMGTANLLDALRGVATMRAAVFITTDKVYRNRDWLWPYREDDPVGGHDPYSASKAASELVIDSYRKAFLAEQGIAVASARAGNVIGGGDWSEDRLIPDALRAWSAGEVLHVRRPDAIRPWQHVVEPLAGYMVLAERLWHDPELSSAYNFGPCTSESTTVRGVVELARAAYGQGEVRYGDGREGPHEDGRLTLETGKAREVLRFWPRLSVTEAVWRTISWHQRQFNGADARSLCEQDIGSYESGQ